MLTQTSSSFPKAAEADSLAGISPQEQVEAMSHRPIKANNIFIFFSVITLSLRIPGFFGPEISQIVYRAAVRPSLPV